MVVRAIGRTQGCIKLDERNSIGREKCARPRTKGWTRMKARTSNARAEKEEKGSYENGGGWGWGCGRTRESRNISPRICE